MFPAGEIVRIYRFSTAFVREEKLSVMFPSPPPAVHAATTIANSDLIVLLYNNAMYTYKCDGTAPSLTCGYVMTVDITSNVAQNPFRAYESSPLPHAPEGITAMAASNDGMLVISYAAGHLYRYQTGDWSDMGLAATPPCE